MQRLIKADCSATSDAVSLWRALLRVIAVLNLALWCTALVAVHRGWTGIHGQTDISTPLQLLLSAVYVIGCAYRSVLPVYDIPRIVLVDTRWSSVFVGRTIATIAELCFAAQCALTLERVSMMDHSVFGHVAALMIVPLIVIAEVCSWYAVLTTAQLGHAIENALWGLSAALMVASLLMTGPYQHGELYLPVVAWCVLGAAYVLFMFWYDVPMYWSRWRADLSTGRQYLSLAQGMADVARRRVVSRRWQDWKSEVLWMTLYFSIGVWGSLSMVYVSIALDANGR